MNGNVIKEITLEGAGGVEVKVVRTKRGIAVKLYSGTAEGVDLYVLDAPDTTGEYDVEAYMYVAGQLHEMVEGYKGSNSEYNGYLRLLESMLLGR
jgi:hypothetical protein